jgi:lysophospholipase L1-like esterase
LALSNKQKSFILKNKKSKSAQQLSKGLNVDLKEVEQFLSTIKTKKTPKIFYLILVLIPILFVVLLEIGLRLFNYGIDTKTWDKVGDEFYELNPKFAYRYFYTVKNVPQSIQDVFRINKVPNTFRVFVLGGSSAAGYPFMPLGAFSRYIRQRLEIEYPNTNIEVVNLSLTAVNSYTILDLIPDVVDQKPDLVLIYAGHNEYYGALGVGSMETLGNSRAIVKFVISLNQYRTVQLLRNIIKNVLSAVKSHNKKPDTGTLMSRMAQDQTIFYNSEVFNRGADQFKNNIDEVLQTLKNNNIPVIISTLACNLKDQKPFISEKDINYPPASIIYKQAQEEIQKQNFTKADSLYRYAKDLDLLRFRAPEKINSSINALANKYKIPIVDVDNYFCKISPQKVTGNNLMTDHLHPTMHGYQIIGKLFYEKMEEEDLVPSVKKTIYSDKIADSLTVANFKYSHADSLLANYKILILKNDWPFVTNGNRIPPSKLIKTSTYVDSVVSNCAIGAIEWNDMHTKLANYFLKKNEFQKFKTEMNVLIYQYPIIPEFYHFLVTELIRRKKYNEAYPYLVKNYEIKKDQFSTKWLGIIDLSKHKLDNAINLLNISLSFNPDDEQVLYNLSGAYAQKKEYKKALELINNCVKINPNYTAAIGLKKQLEAILKK